MLSSYYLATEFSGDPPTPAARWYKVQAGTYARVTDHKVDFFYAADLKFEQSVGTIIEHVSGDGSDTDIDAIVSAWQRRKAVNV